MNSYLNKDRKSIYRALVNSVPSYTDAWVPGIQSDPGEVYLQSLSDVADSIYFLQDRNILETYISTVTERKNAQRILDAPGYQLAWRQSGLTQVTLTPRTPPSGSYPKIEMQFNLIYGTTNQLVSLRGAVASRASVNYIILPEGALESALGYRPDFQIGTSDDVTWEGYSGEGVTPPEPTPVVRWAVQGSLRTLTTTVREIKANGNLIRFTNPAIDIRYVWVYDGMIFPGSNLYTVWRRLRTVMDEARGFPGFSMEVDEYEIPIIRFNSHLETFKDDDERITVLYIESAGAAGNVNKNAFSSLRGIPTDRLFITNPSNVLTQYNISEAGRDAMTAREAFLDSRLYINTQNSIITLYNYRAFLSRQLHIAYARCADCQKMKEINEYIFNNTQIPDDMKLKKYVWMDTDMSPTFELPMEYKGDFPGQEKEYPIYTLACFLSWGRFQRVYSDADTTSSETTTLVTADMVHVPGKFYKYLVSQDTQNMIDTEQAKLGALSVELRYCYYRIFPFLITGIVYPNARIRVSEACQMLQFIYRALGNSQPKLFSYRSSMTILDRAFLMGIVESVRGVRQFDMGTLTHPKGIYYNTEYTDSSELPDSVDIDYVNYTSAYLYQDPVIVNGTPITRDNYKNLSIKIYEGAIIDDDANTVQETRE